MILRSYSILRLNRYLLRRLNYHIRSDPRNQLLLRTKMKEADVELIRGIAQGDKRPAVQALKEKFDRESIYNAIVMRNGVP